MNFTATAALGTLVFTFVNLLKYLRVWVRPNEALGEKRVDGYNGAITLLIGFAAGMLGVWLVAQTQFADNIRFGTLTLASMSTWSLLFIGLIATSILSTVNEVKKAIDPNDTSRTPSLFSRTTQSSPVSPVTMAAPAAQAAEKVSDGRRASVPRTKAAGSEAPAAPRHQPVRVEIEDLDAESRLVWLGYYSPIDSQ